MTYHQELSAGRWQTLSLAEQMANIGSEVERTISWRQKNNTQFSQRAFDRALELLDLTISSSNNPARLKELARLREVLADYFAFDNVYGSTDQLWQKYFFAFNYSARATA